MSEYRYNLLTDRWTILAGDRAHRPHRIGNHQAPTRVDFEHDCPFCPGNEHTTPPETFAIRPDGSVADRPGWSVRVVTNKFPALTPDAEASPAHPQARPGTGIHEVIIESPQHNRSFADHPADHAQQVLRVLRDRYRTHAQSSAPRLICIFNNHGANSGASLGHPHFQLIAPTIVPAATIERLAHYEDYYKQHHRSVFDAFLETELDDGERIIATNEHFVALCPFGSRCPFEAYIVPRESLGDFDSTSDSVLASLVELLQPPLARLNDGMGGTGYNLAFHTAPLDRDEHNSFRWYVEIHPRLTTRGGFEICTHMYINTITPETAAAFYRGETDI